ncbi:ABC transporter permease [Labrys sp. KB_33_2]|uniref:ABC transporter permease n=1 Tax=Labrys sp. KB_33_2 TaxID=3237479 RepID=UPI003F8F581B
MSLFAFVGSIEIGLIYALIALGVFLSFRVLDFPDLTVDGSYPLGAATAAAAIVAGFDAFSATALAIFAGALAGMMTAWLNIRFRILQLLASILTMTALYSINLRIMGRPNVPLLNQETLVTWTRDHLMAIFGWAPPSYQLKVWMLGVIVLIVWALLSWFLNSEFGLAMRATGANPRMARAQGVSTQLHNYVGMAISNALVALAGALFAQTSGFADITLGTGTIVGGLASVILGETLFRTRSIAWLLVACVVGAILYRLAIALALNSEWSRTIGLNSSDQNLVTSVLVGLALILPSQFPRLRAIFAPAPKSASK